MSSHISSSQPVENQQSPSSLSQSFSPWVRHQSWSLTAQISAAVGLLFYLAEIAYYSPYLGKNSEPIFSGGRFPVIIDILHIIVISGFIVMTIRLLDDNKRGSERVKFLDRRIFKETRLGYGGKENLTDEGTLQKRAEVNSDKKKDEGLDSKEEEKVYEKKLGSCYYRLKRFKKNFLWFWIGMLALYIVLGCHHAYLLSPKSEAKDSEQVKEQKDKDNAHRVLYVAEEAIDPAKKLRTIYLVEEVIDPKESTEKKGNTWTIIIFPVISFLINTITMIPISSCFLILYYLSDKEGKEESEDKGKESEDERKIKRARLYFIMAIGFFCLLYGLLIYLNWGKISEGSWKNFHAVFFALSGILNALTFALLITRLDSKLFGLRSWLICILYSYAAIQPLFAVFEFDAAVMFQITSAVLALAFILKVYFFLIIMYAVQTGKMLNYLFSFPTLNKRTAYSSFLSRGPLVPKVRKFFSFRALKNLIINSRRMFVGFSLPVLIGVLTTIAFIAVLLSPLIFGPLDQDTSKPDNFGKIVAGLASVLQVILIGLMIKWLCYDGRHYRDISENLPSKENNVPPLVIKNSHMRIERVREKADWLFKTKISDGILEDCIMQIRGFNDRFIIFWVLTLALHMVLAASHIMEVYWSEWERETLLPVSFITFILSVSNLLALFHCFLLLDSPPTEDKNSLLLDSPPIEEKNSLKKLRMSMGYSNLAAGLLVGMAVFVFILVGAHGKPLEYQKGFVTLLDGITGTMSGLAIALVIARMSSRWFGLNLPITYVLLLYAAIQPLYLFIHFAKLESMTIGVLVAALGLKVSFFLAIRTCLRRGALLNYFICLPLLRDRVNKIIENHFEVTLTPTEHGKYKLNILKNGKLQFTSREEFSTKTKCDKFIKDFTKELKDLKKRQDDKREPESIEEIKNTNLRPGEKLGAFWLEWVEKENPDDKIEAFRCMWIEKESDEDVVLLESVTLRSEEQVLELRQEAIDMIPYCRYNR
jgi:hypothetical protein